MIVITEVLKIGAYRPTPKPPEVGLGGSVKVDNRTIVSPEGN